MFAGRWQVIRAVRRTMWAAEGGYCQLIRAGNGDVCRSGGGCLQAATATPAGCSRRRGGRVLLAAAALRVSGRRPIGLRPAVRRGDLLMPADARWVLRGACGRQPQPIVSCLQPGGKALPRGAGSFSPAADHSLLGLVHAARRLTTAF
jgi:hypothetical protein